MKKASMITCQLFRLQFAWQIILHLDSLGFIDINDEQAKEAQHSLARLFARGVNLSDFNYEFTVTDKDDNKKFVA